MSLPVSSIPIKTRFWKRGLIAAPGLGLSLVPKVICPFCWPSYAALLSSLGLGFLISTAYLLPLTAILLSACVGSLAYQAPRRRGLGPFWLGLGSIVLVLTGKFYFNSALVTYGGVALLATASIWNVWPRRAENAHCPACILVRGLPTPEGR